MAVVMMATVVARAAWAAAIETRTATVATAAVGTATAIAAASAAAERPLEARARIAADARGVARKVFTALGGAGAVGSTRLARQEDDVVPDCGGFGDGFSRGGGNKLLFVGMFDFDGLFGAVFFVSIFGFVFVFGSVLGVV